MKKQIFVTIAKLTLKNIGTAWKATLLSMMTMDWFVAKSAWMKTQNGKGFGASV